MVLEILRAALFSSYSRFVTEKNPPPDLLYTKFFRFLFSCFFFPLRKRSREAVLCLRSLLRTALAKCCTDDEEEEEEGGGATDGGHADGRDRKKDWKTGRGRKAFICCAEAKQNRARL